jgi:uncharacterized iron-regulated membrane protein
VVTVTYRGLWRWHFHAGLFCIPFLLVLAITGSIYLFKPQIDAFADRGVDSLQITGQRATGEAQIAAAIASRPGSKIFSYEIPRQADDAVRVHLYSEDGTGRIVYLHPETLAVLKTIPHTSRLTEILKTIHGELFAGRWGSTLVELAASWAIVMLITGLYLWWPRETHGAGGVIYPRLGCGRRVFWRDLHAVTGIWVSTLAMFLLISALPWTTVWGAGFDKARALAAPAEEKDWSSGRADEHAAHLHDMQAAGAALTTPVTLDEIVIRANALRLDPPVRIYLPSEHQPFWKIRSETQNIPRVREIELDARTGEPLRERNFGDRPMMDRVVGVGIAAHEGQLFGPANQALGLFTALGLITLCVSAIVMWWRRRPGGRLGVPAPPVPEFRIGMALGIAIVALGIFLPMLGVALILLWIFDRITRPRATHANH